MMGFDDLVLQNDISRLVDLVASCPTEKV